MQQDGQLTSGWTWERQVKCGYHWALDLSSTYTLSPFFVQARTAVTSSATSSLSLPPKGCISKERMRSPTLVSLQAPGGPGLSGPGGWSGEGLVTALSPRREPLRLCVPAFHHGPGPALQTHHPAERWVWPPRKQHRGTESGCSH